MGMIDDAELEAYAAEALPQFELDQLEGSVDTGLVARVDEHLRLSLRRVNDLPADDPLWSGTNRRPTLFKAQEWFRQQFDHDPGDNEARWVVLSYKASTDAAALRNLVSSGTPPERRAARVALAVMDGTSLRQAIAAAGS